MRRPGTDRSGDGIYSDGELPPPLPPGIISDNERFALALINRNGLVRIDEGDEQRVEVPAGLVVTEEHIVFGTLDGGASDRGALAYSELAGIEIQYDALAFRTTDGVTWKFQLIETDSEAVDIALRHLCWIGGLREQLVDMVAEVELIADRVENNSTRLNGEKLVPMYEETRRELDELFCLVQCTTPLKEDVLAPELIDIERTLEKTATRLLIQRTQAKVHRARELIADEEYEQARIALDEARERYERAQAHREETERSDSFQFGTQRTLATDLDELRWKLKSTAAEPLQQAHEAKLEAEATEDLKTAIERWETTFRRYRAVLSLEWADHQHFEGEPENVRAEIDNAGVRLIELHERAARKRWNEGARLEASGQLREAIQECTAALDHLERVHELAEHFDPQQAQEFEARLQKMFEKFLEMRGTRSQSRSDEDQHSSERDNWARTDDGPGTTEERSVGTFDEHAASTLDPSSPLEKVAAEKRRERTASFERVSDPETASGFEFERVADTTDVLDESTERRDDTDEWG